MKKSFLFLCLAIMAFTFAGFLEQLQMSKSDAEAYIWQSFSNGTYSGMTNTKWHEFPVSVRVAMIKEIGAFAKTYTQSEDFKRRYAEYREERKPTPPVPPKSMETMRKEAHDQ